MPIKSSSLFVSFLCCRHCSLSFPKTKKRRCHTASWVAPPLLTSTPHYVKATRLFFLLHILCGHDASVLKTFYILGYSHFQLMWSSSYICLYPKELCLHILYPLLMSSLLIVLNLDRFCRLESLVQLILTKLL